MTKSIQHTFFYQHPPEAVWEYLTKPELIAQWLMPNDFTPLVGCDFQFRTKPIPQIDFDGIFYCKVLELVPNKRLCYSWKGGPGEGKITVDTIVLWTLAAKDGGTELRLEQSGFKELENYTIYTMMNDGWFKNCQKISALLNTATHGPASA